MKHFLTLFALLTTLLAFGQESCPNMHDSNANGTIDIEDFLSVLGLFGDVDADSDGLWDSQDGCTDIDACNYLEPLAGICTYPDALGDCNGNCPADEDGDGVCDVFYCGASVSYQGYDYETVSIGGQCWFAENLRNENYENGDLIPFNLDDVEWANTSSGATAVFGESTLHLDTYGRLYNWYAVDDSRGLCPSGWHVPSDGEWMTLEIFLGMSEEEANNSSWRGTDQGIQMKATYGWSNGGNGTNSSGFSGLPGGYRNPGNGNYAFATSTGYWWTSSVNSSGFDGDEVWRRMLENSWEQVRRMDGDPTAGFSVRCIQDAE